MAELSISRAWDGAKATIASDGRLIAIVAAALIALPGLITGVASPGAGASDRSLMSGIIILVASLIAVVGQLAIIRLALGSAVSVGEAIGHGLRRLPIYIVAGLLIAIGLLVAIIPVALVLYASGVPLEAGNAGVIRSPVGMVAVLAFLALVIFVGVRMLMTSPVASEEGVGPVAILRRSWQLTAGHWWRLFGFLMLFLIGIGVAMAAISWIVSSLALALFGPIEPMSASALLVALVDSIVNAAVTALLAVMLARIYAELAGRESLDVSVPRSGT